MKNRFEETGSHPRGRIARWLGPLALAAALLIACSPESRNPAEEFVGSCIRDCVQETGDGSVCDGVCNCIVRDLGNSEPPEQVAERLRAAIDGSSDPVGSARLREARERCRQSASSG